MTREEQTALNTKTRVFNTRLWVSHKSVRSETSGTAMMKNMEGTELGGFSMSKGLGANTEGPRDISWYS